VASIRVLIVDINNATVIGCLHDPANIEQTSSKCIPNNSLHVLIARRLLDVCSMFASIHPASSTSYGN